ncbi:MAG: hypothetical protein JNM56_19935, partial [Planctomycetia bacterium]|nr:hypothetical protein [Planctomycetia bacterium]
MKLLTKIEAAMFLGVGVELIDYFVENSPKPKGDVKLPVAKSSEEAGQQFSQADLIRFSDYLNEPWPLPPKGTRPHIPDAIKKDIKRESHLGCGICGLMTKGQVAHIEPVAET